jgi:hypothetical protein
VDSLLRSELEEDHCRIILRYLETEDPADLQLLGIIELLLEVPEEKP